MLDAGSAEPLYTGTLDCLIKIVQNGGITSLWNGVLLYIFRIEAEALLAAGLDGLAGSSCGEYLSLLAVKK